MRRKCPQDGLDTVPRVTCSVCEQVKVKVKLSLCLTKNHAIKRYWGLRYSATHSLTSALEGGECSASRPGSFIVGERAPGTHWIGERLDPRAALDTVEKRNITSSRRVSNPWTSIFQPVASLYTTERVVPFFQWDVLVNRQWFYFSFPLISQ
jgi:hypothetical protein